LVPKNWLREILCGIFAQFAFSIETKESKELIFEAMSEGARQNLLEILIYKMEENKAQKLVIKTGELESSHEQHNFPGTPMKIALVTIGTRGDVQPLIVFAKELQKHGHHVWISSHEEYHQWVNNEGIEFKKFGGNPAELVNLMTQHTVFGATFLRKALSVFFQWFDELLLNCLEACLVVAHFFPLLVNQEQFEMK